MLLEVAGESGRPAESAFTLRESWMHILIDRLSDAERAEAIEDELRQALDYVRAVVGDGGALTAAAATAAGRAARHVLPAVGAGGRPRPPTSCTG